MTKIDDIYITVDVDWAPDFMIEELASVFIQHRTKSTWFITHSSPVIDKLKQRDDLFELGIHPNFAVGSTQGSTQASIYYGLKKVVPQTKLMRTHGLLCSNNILIEAADVYGIQIDSSILMPRTENISFYEINWTGNSLYRIPIFWEDDYEACQKDSIYSLRHDVFGRPGLKVLNFHPIHFHLNTINYELYVDMKKYHSIAEVYPGDLSQFQNTTARGPREFLIDLCHSLKMKSKWLSQVVN